MMRHHIERYTNHLGTEHIEYYCSNSDMLEIVDRTFQSYNDEPFLENKFQAKSPTTPLKIP